MPSEIKLWQIEENTPRSVDHSTLDLESRLERWIRQDIGLVNDDLLVIGQQVKTAYGGIIDLLAVDSDANLVILELKKGQTPREVVAQAMDYASWVQNLDYEYIKELAEEFLADGKPLEQTFKEKFDDDLPEIINEDHRIYIVASSLDSSTERIIEYLSDTHGVNINAATFTYFKTPDDNELIGRSMLLDEESVQAKSQTKGGSKRKPSPTIEEFRAIAEEKGVVDLWDKAYKGFLSIPGVRTGRKPNFLNFRARLREDQRPVWLLSTLPHSVPQEPGLQITVHPYRISRYFNLDQRPDCGSVRKRRRVRH